MRVLRAFRYAGPEGYLEPVWIQELDKAEFKPAIYVIAETDRELLRAFPKRFCFIDDRDPETDASLWDYFYNVAQASTVSYEQHPVVTKHYRRRQSLRGSLKAFWQRLSDLPEKFRERVPRLQMLAERGERGTHFLCLEQDFFDEDLDGRRKFRAFVPAKAFDPSSEVPNWAHEVMDDSLWGNSAAMHDVRELIWRTARYASKSGLLAHVLVQGPAGSGKEVVAELIHRFSFDEHSTVPPGSVTVLDCRALSGKDLSFRLFGWVDPDGELHRGALETCRTVILDRVVDMDYGVQRKLEQALLDADPARGVSTRFAVTTIEETEEPFREAFASPAPDGELREGRARIIALSGADLHANTDRFRAQLHFLLSRCVITTPSLLDHPQDIPELANHFWLRSATHHQPLPPDVLAQLSRIKFRGNGREVEYLMLNAAQHFPAAALLSLAQLREVLEISGYLPDGSASHESQARRRVRQIKDIIARTLMELDYLEHLGGDPAASRASLESKVRELSAFVDGGKLDGRVAEVVARARGVIEEVLGGLALGGAGKAGIDSVRERLTECVREIEETGGSS